MPAPIQSCWSTLPGISTGLRQATHLLNFFMQSSQTSNTGDWTSEFLNLKWWQSANKWCLFFLPFFSVGRKWRVIEPVTWSPQPSRVMVNLPETKPAKKIRRPTKQSQPSTAANSSPMSKSLHRELCYWDFVILVLVMWTCLGMSVVFIKDTMCLATPNYRFKLQAEKWHLLNISYTIENQFLNKTIAVYFMLHEESSQTDVRGRCL